MLQKGISMKKGFLSNLYPTTKGLFVIVSLILSLFFDWQFAYFFILPLTLVLAMLDGSLFSFAKKVLFALIVFVLFIFVFKVMLDQESLPVLFDFGFFVITEQAIIEALNQTKLLVVLTSTIFLFFETTELEDLMIALQKLNMSHMVSYILLSTMQLIPDMSKKSKVILQAQQARGIETKGSLLGRLQAFLPSLGPLIISSIADVEDRAVTLEVRGFSSDNKKTNLKELKQSSMDRVVTIGMVVFAVGALIWRVLA